MKTTRLSGNGKKLGSGAAHEDLLKNVFDFIIRDNAHMVKDS